MPKFLTHRWIGITTSWTLGIGVVLLTWLLTGRLAHALIILFGVLLLIFLHYKMELDLRRKYTQYVLTLTDRIQYAGQLAMKRLPIGMILYSSDGKIEWYNSYITALFPKVRLVGEPMTEFFPELKDESGWVQNPVRMQIHGHHYEFIHQSTERLFIVREVTELVTLQEKYQSEKPVLGFLHLDNIDEAGQGLTDQEETLLISKVFQKISEWALRYEVAIKRIDTDKMFFITEQKHLDQIIQSRFDVLDSVRELTRGNKIPITLSIGVANTDGSSVELSKSAQAALEVALARGGDQAAVQNKEKISFFGGKTNAVEKRNRVKARVVSHAISNLLNDAKRVVIMGHKNPDLDAIGSAIGVVKLAELNDCEAYIVLDEHLTAVDRLMDEIKSHEYLGDIFVSSDKAYHWVGDPDTICVLVDTHKRSMVTEPKILDRAERIVIIDHHRRGEDFVEDAVLVYLEPYASSTSELVTELLQYQDYRLSLDTLEATALFSGIVVDTKNFSIRAGSRTFEAASFLRRHGADLMLVQSLLKEGLNQFIKRAEVIKNTELIDNHIAIAIGEENEVYDQLIIAQAADTLLSMQGITASFVLGYREEGVVSISARSEGDLNVQLIMEQMGGGGHLTHAACQPRNKTLTECKQQIIDLLHDMETGEEAK